MLRRFLGRKSERTAPEPDPAPVPARLADHGTGSSASSGLSGEVVIGGEGRTPPFVPLNDSDWEDYERYWSWDKEWFDSLNTWRKVRRVVHQHWNLDTRLWQAYARREVDGVLPAIRICEEMIALAPLAKEALPLDHEIEQEFLKQEERRRSREYERLGITFSAWQPLEREFRMPEHRGFKQLAIIREKEKDFAAAIEVCRAALELDWPGDWDVRIARCERRMVKQAGKPSRRKASDATAIPMYCTQCGTSVGANDAFCASCGTRIAKAPRQGS